MSARYGYTKLHDPTVSLNEARALLWNDGSRQNPQRNGDLNVLKIKANGSSGGLPGSDKSRYFERFAALRTHRRRRIAEIKSRKPCRKERNLPPKAMAAENGIN